MLRCSDEGLTLDEELFPDLFIDATFCEELIVCSVNFNNNIRVVIVFTA